MSQRVHPAWRVVSIVIILVLMLLVGGLYSEGGTMAIRLLGIKIPAWVYFPIMALVLLGQIKELVKPTKAQASAAVTAAPSTPPAAGSSSPGEQPAPVEAQPTKGRPVNASCNWCQKEVTGTAVEFDAWAGLSGVGRGDIIGFECPSCGAVSHPSCKDSGIRFSVWSGYSNSLCGKCKNPAPKPRVVLLPAKAKAAGADAESPGPNGN